MKKTNSLNITSPLEGQEVNLELHRKLRAHVIRAAKQQQNPIVEGVTHDSSRKYIKPEKQTEGDRG